MRGLWFTTVGARMIVLLICWICSITIVRAAASSMVNVKNGTLEGTVMKSRKGREFMAFRGIPYAQPPQNQLRFEPPKPYDSWSGVRSAKDDTDVCIQRDLFRSPNKVFGSEDCLYLNVYTPSLPSNNHEESPTTYPVMVWIHGGGWITGSAHSLLYGPKFLLDHDVVLVTVNYRLGALGFLSTEDLVSPGNQGLKDQAQAIRWVHENIAAFGGDPNRVTIFGQSAGGASGHYHMISSQSRGLFHRVIAQSGTALCPWTMARPGSAKRNANKLGKLLDCPADGSSVLVDCLKKKDARAIIEMDLKFQVFGYCPVVPFRPVVEPDHPGAFITEDPAETMKSGQVADIPFMTGITSHEGAIKVATIYGSRDEDFVKLLDEKFMELAPITLLYESTCPKEILNNVTKSIREFYLGNENIDESTRLKLVDLYTDAWFYIGTDNTVREYLETLSSPVYYYFLAYRGSSSQSSIFGDPEREYGVSHSDDLQYLFPISELLFPDKPLTEEDHKVVNVMTELWVNFAKSGNPTPERTVNVPIKWKPVRTSKLEYLHIGDSKNLHMADNLLPERREFWTNIPHRGNVDFIRDAQRARDEL